MKRTVSRGLHRNHINICKFAAETESDFRTVKARFDAVAIDIKADAEAVKIVQTEPAETTEETIRKRLEALPEPPQAI